MTKELLDEVVRKGLNEERVLELMLNNESATGASVESMFLAVGTASPKTLRWKPIYGGEDQKEANAAHIIHQEVMSDRKQGRKGRQGWIMVGLVTKVRSLDIILSALRDL